jgi:hypothetical protein
MSFRRRRNQSHTTLIAEQGIVRDCGLAGRTNARLLHPRAALTEVTLVIAELMLLRQRSITLNAYDLRRTRHLAVHWTPPVLHGLAPAHVFADVKYNKPFPRFSLFGGILGERACEYRKSAWLDYAH